MPKLQITQFCSKKESEAWPLVDYLGLVAQDNKVHFTQWILFYVIL